MHKITGVKPPCKEDYNNEKSNPYGRYCYIARDASGGLQASAQDADTETAGEEELRQSSIVVTGTRSTDRTALETAVPVDVFPIGELTETGRVELNQILAATVPSFNFNQTSINDGTDIIRPATLRGLAPDQTLVLVNSKRRHSSSLVNINGAVERGSAAVDLNSIPTAAIGSV